MQALRNQVVVVLGATGAGKSKLALELGIRFNGEIINADSMQVYKGLNIITNKVTAEEQKQCPHHALGMVHPLQRFSVVDFRNRVIPLIDGLLSRGRLPIIVGGTNYYIEALLWKVLLTNENSSQGLMFETKGEVERLRLRRNNMPGRTHYRRSQESSDASETILAEPYGHEDAPQVQPIDRLHANETVMTANQSDPGFHCESDGSDQSETPINSSTSCGRIGATPRQSESRTEPLCIRTSQSQVQVVDTTLAKGDDDSLKNSDDASPTLNVSCNKNAEVIEVQVNKMESSELHQLLQDIDPEMASKLHPNDRRKIIRSLQVYEQYGVCHSDLLREQRAQKGGSHLGGPLRYTDSCVFWVQADQSVLDIRLDKRVDGMMHAGLLKELEDFHKEYNEQRLAGSIQEEELYTQGIFQSIGFKEFHPYLVVDEDRKKSPEGQRLLEESTERLKTATRQYARRQLKWIRNRFLKRGSNSPAVYGLDATQPEEWAKNVLEPASRILEAVMQGKDSPISPLPCEERKVNELPQTYVCDVCSGRQFVGHQQWTAHLTSRRHQKQARKKRLRELMDLETTKRQAVISAVESATP